MDVESDIQHVKINQLQTKLLKTETDIKFFNTAFKISTYGCSILTAK